MNKLITSSLLLVGVSLASCTSTTPSASSSRIELPSTINESYITESFISETIISEDVISEEVIEAEYDLWFDTYDIMRSPTEEERLLAPSWNFTPNRKEYTFGEKKYTTSFDHMDEDAFNGFDSNYDDPSNRGWSVILYVDGKFDGSFGKGVGLLGNHRYANEVENATAETLEIFISYSVSDNSTNDANDIVTIKVGEFKLQPAVMSEAE